MTANVPRLIYLNLMLLFYLSNWVMEFFNPVANAKLWLAGIFGAFLLRLLIPGLPTRKHLTGWLVGTISAFLWGESVHIHWLPGMAEYAVWGLVGFAFDLLLQLVVYLITYARDNPAQAFDAGLERVERVAGVWSRIKEPLGSLLDFFRKPKQ